MMRDRDLEHVRFRRVPPLPLLTKRTYRDVRLESVMRSKADVTYGNRSPPRLAATFRRSANNTFANDAARDQLEFKLVITPQRLAGLRRHSLAPSLNIYRPLSRPLPIRLPHL